MDVIFAKAVPSPSHHYSRLLKRNKGQEPNASEDFFAVKPPSSPHLYTPRGIIKGHRRTNSEVPAESPNGGKSGLGALSKTTEKSHFELSAELTTSLHQKLEEIVRHLDSSQRKGLTELIEKLQTETQAAKTEAAVLKLEVEQTKASLREAEAHQSEAEKRCSRLQTQVARLTQENQEFEVRFSEDPRGEFRDSLSASLERETANETITNLQQELKEKTKMNERLQRRLDEALKEVKAAKGRSKGVRGDCDREDLD